MSQAHIPQPDATGAPSEQFGSTESAPVGPTISGIGNPGPQPVEAITHALAHNGIDPILYQQFIYNSMFTWSTSDQPGKLLWSTPITPLAYNKITARLATLYNIWTGGADFNFKIAGTGFHAGALVFVRIPPNYTPQELSGSFDFTAFEYVVIDPKQLEVASFHVGDQRLINYHYVNPETSQPESWDIGGHIACYVQMALNTASTGTQQIQITSWSRLAQDFNFVQLRMPREITDVKTDLLPTTLAYLLNFSQQSYNTYTLSTIPCTGVRAVYLKVLPASIKILYTGIVQTYNLKGEDNSDWYNKVANMTTRMLNAKVSPSKIGIDMEADKVQGLVSIQNAQNVYILNLKASNMPKAEKIQITGATRTGTLLNLNVKFPDGTSEGDELIVTPADQTELPHEKCAKVGNITLPVAESFITFSGYNSGVSGMVQTTELANYFKSKVLENWLPTTKCALFSVIDAVENLPMFQVKMYSEGLFSTLPNAALTIYKLQRLRFEFIGFIERTDSLRVNPQMSVNRMLLSSVHRKELRHDQSMNDVIPTTVHRGTV